MSTRAIPLLTLALSGLYFSTLPLVALSEPQQSNTEEANVALPLPPRVTGLGMIGDDSVAWGDMMVPLVGNSNGAWFVDVQAKTAFDTDWLGSAGTGVRKVINPNSIWGAYLFVDRTVSPDNNTFWFVSPGIEELGTMVDFRANGYFPTSTKQQYGRTDWADNFGVYDYVSFQGHDQYDILLTQDEEVGWGGDAEIGVKIPGLANTRAYVGGYHFSFDTASDINGVAGRIELPINRYLGVTVRDSYDNEQHNTFLVGLKLTFGGVNAHPTNPHQAIQERLLDPIERNMATLGQGVGEPVQDILTPASSNNNPNPPPPSIERSNIWFFSEEGTTTFSGNLEDCTIENQCASTDFTQATIDGINTLSANSPDEINYDDLGMSPAFYLAPGTYTSSNNGAPLEFTNDWVFGRTDDFVMPSLTSILSGAMIFNGNDNKLNHIILQSDGTQDTGIVLNPTSHLIIENSRIGSMMLGENYHTAIEVDNATLEVIGKDENTSTTRSDIIAYGNDGAPVIGIDANYTANLGAITISASDVTAATELNQASSALTQSAIALNLINAPSVTIDQTATINATATFNGDQTMFEQSNLATGIYASGSTVTMTEATITASATVTGDNSGANLATGIGANSVDSSISPAFQNNTFTISNSSITASALIEQTNLGINMSAGIGENVINFSDFAHPTIFDRNSSQTTLSTGNTFSLDDTTVNSTATINNENNGGFNMVTGIGGNAYGDIADASLSDNSFTLVNGSEIIVAANIEGISDNTGTNLVTGIGGNSEVGASANFESNSITLAASSILSSITTPNEDVNLDNGIGGNAADVSQANFGGDSAEEANTITLRNGSSISVTSTVDGNNFDNIVSAIGGNAFAEGSTANFNYNTITLDGSAGRITITANANVEGSNEETNFATGVGGNSGFDGFADFNFNTIELKNAAVTATASIGLDNNENSSNFAVGIGGNAASSDANFTGNQITIEADASENPSTVTATAAITGDNLSLAQNQAAALGGNATSTTINAAASTSFTDNTIEVLTKSSLTATASIDGNNVGAQNSATGLGGNGFGVPLTPIADVSFIDNDITLNNATLSATASTTDNSGYNIAVALGSFYPSDIPVPAADVSFASDKPLTITNDSTLNANAIVSGTNNGTTIAAGIEFTNATGMIDMDNSTINASSTVTNNMALNLAYGIDLYRASNMTVGIDDSIIDVTATSTNSSGLNATQARGINVSNPNDTPPSPLIFNINDLDIIATSSSVAVGISAASSGNATTFNLTDLTFNLTAPTTVNCNQAGNVTFNPDCT